MSNLTKTEKEELKLLANALKIVAMKARAVHLTSKQMHNKCLCVGCVGFQGTDVDIYCPKCGTKLMKYMKGE